MKRISLKEAGEMVIFVESATHDLSVIDTDKEALEEILNGNNTFYAAELINAEVPADNVVEYIIEYAEETICTEDDCVDNTTISDNLRGKFEQVIAETAEERISRYYVVGEQIEILKED